MAEFQQQSLMLDYLHAKKSFTFALSFFLSLKMELSPQILFRDEYLVAINKPHGLLVHKSPIAADASEFAVQWVRNWLVKYVYPVHRLDRKTAGVLLFALDPTTNSLMQQQFMQHQPQKTYHAIVRGYTEEQGIVDAPLRNETGRLQQAVTHYRRLKTAELDIPSAGFATSRYSLLEVMPETGRMHQIRRHLAHIFHPVIGDRPHGCNKQNRLFLQQFQHSTLLLHSVSLRFVHPVSNVPYTIEASYQPEFLRIMPIMGWAE